MDQSNFERIGQASDRLDNLAHMLTVPGIPAATQVDALQNSLPEIRDAIREALIQETGQDPWNGTGLVNQRTSSAD